MKIKPIGERVLIKPVKMEEKTASGIILPGISKQIHPNRGEIIALGLGESISGIELGDIIIFEKNAGTPVEDGDETYLILNGEDILAVIEEA